MWELLGIGNPGFSFTNIYLKDILKLVDTVKENSERIDITFVDLQEMTDNPSRVRMIVPFLKDMGIISETNFVHKNQSIDLKNFFTEEARPFLLFLDIYREIDTANIENNEKVRVVLNEVLHLYFSKLCKKKLEYKIIFDYLRRYKSLDKYEFFVICTFEFNQVKMIENYTNASDWIDNYRNGNIDSSNYSFKSNVNCYSYIMNIFVDMGICKKNDNNFKLF